MDVSEKRDEWTRETEEKRDHLDFATRITVHELYGTRVIPERKRHRALSQ